VDRVGSRPRRPFSITDSRCLLSPAFDGGAFAFGLDPNRTYSLCGETASISLYLVCFSLRTKRTLAMGIFEPLIEHSDANPPGPRHRRDVVAPILFALLAVVLLAVVLLVWGG
jgi:hypothetical protein